MALADDIVYGISVAISGETVLIGGLRFVQPVAFQSGAWTDQSPRLTPPAGPTLFGMGALAIDGDTALVGDSQRDDQKGAAYVFVRAGGAWNAPPVKLAASDGIAGDGFGGSGGISGNLAVISADGANNSAGVAYLFTRAGTTWSQTARLSPANASPNDAFGRSVAISGITAVVGSPGKRAVADGGRTGAAYTYLFSNVAVYSNPSGRTFKLAGAQCSDAGTFTTPYFGLWDACSLKWTSPETIGASTRYTFENWSDGYTDNPRSLLGNSTYTANFLTEYYLFPRAVPATGGAVTGESWYKAGTSAGVLAQANPGFVFTGFNAPLNSATNPQSVVINGPVNAIANFAPTPPATLSALITAKSGTPVNRQWTITLTNNGPGVAYSAQLFGMGFTQTFGTVCTVPPIRLSPSAFPVSLGLLNVGSSAQLTAAIDFTGCPATARFTVSVGYMANGGSSLGLLPLVNQFQ